ncbi:hypothetical protein CspHIS471_0302580 [Cutaneotrichosporon sp. HIS471]|nr:hypothetical protein CspHIS471_0302580 [Cutaneotrichosporon sp. HIS471]
MLAPGECSTTDCWISKAGVLVSLDPQFYPYITDQIISNLGLCDLLSFLTTSRYLRYKAIPVLLRHIIFIPHGASGRPKLYLPTAPMIRLPNFDWAVVQNLVKIADYRIPRRSQWLTKIVTAYRLPRLEMIRDLCGINLAPAPLQPPWNPMDQ